MADLLIARTVRRGTTLIDADAPPVLRDPTNAFGLRRDATGEVVVAAGTPLPRESLGRYQLLVTGLVAGAAYTYWRETTVGGTTSRAESHVVVPLALALPSYLTPARADELAGQLHGLDAWLAADAAARARVLPLASMRVDASRRWQGRRTDAAQPLEFPRREDVGDGWDGFDVPSTALAVPLAVETATLLEADSLLAGRRATRVAAQHDGLSAQAIGAASESYRAPADARGVPLLCQAAHALLARYELRSGRLL